MIPESVLAHAREALAQIRDDRAEVKRLDSSTLEDGVVYSDLPCHLSQEPASSQTDGDTASQTAASYTVFFDTSVELCARDAIVVLHKGQIIKGIAGLPLRGNFSVSVRLESVEIA